MTAPNDQPPAYGKDEGTQVRLICCLHPTSHTHICIPVSDMHSRGRDFNNLQEMIAKAQEDYPNLEVNDAIQQEANSQAGREAVVGEGTFPQSQAVA
jgi:hypothetical protein